MAQLLLWMAYNPNCAYADPIEDTGSQVSCLGFMVDVNGKKGPNRVGDDIALKGQISLSNCDNPIGDMCFSTDFAPTAIDTCSDTTWDDHGTDNSYCSTNYWAGAKKACSDMGMSLPTREELAQLASNLYVDSSGNEVEIAYNEDKSGIKLKDEYSKNPPLSLGSSYWSSEERNALYAYCRYFGTTSSTWGGTTKTNSGNRAICVSN